MKGIVLAGGSGSRMFPMTKSISKQLLPIYDKPTVYYPISILMLAGIKEILVISTPRDLPMLKELLGDGKDLGVQFTYKAQEKPNGIAEAFILGEDFIGQESVCLILGDNFFYGHELTQMLEKSAKLADGALVYAYYVKNPSDFGVAEIDSTGKVLSLEEKPKEPKSNWAVTGLYFYDNSVTAKAKKLKPSARGELEITDLNKLYLQEGRLSVKTVGRGMAWLDTGTPEAMLTSAQFVQTVEARQGFKIACLEEISLIKGFITEEHFALLIEKSPKSSYRDYLAQVLKFKKESKAK